jgi:hypothetical protein
VPVPRRQADLVRPSEDQTTADMPNEVKDVTKVFGKTCSYNSKSLSSGTINYDKAKVGDVVGYLQCDGWADAKCYKEDESTYCFGTTMFLRTTCYW